MTLQVLSHLSFPFGCLEAQCTPRGRSNCKTENGIADAMALIRDTCFATKYLCVDSENESFSQVVESYHVCFQFISSFGGWLKRNQRWTSLHMLTPSP